MISMLVDSVRINLQTQQWVVILKAIDEERYLFIWIAHAEAYAIAVELQHQLSSRPMTHDLLKTIIEGTGFNVRETQITHVQDDIYYAQIVLEHSGESLIFDARPSDAIALAVRTHTPILVAEEVLQAQNSSSQTTQKQQETKSHQPEPSPETQTNEQHQQIEVERLRQESAFLKEQLRSAQSKPEAQTEHLDTIPEDELHS